MALPVNPLLESWPEGFRNESVFRGYLLFFSGHLRGLGGLRGTRLSATISAISISLPPKFISIPENLTECGYNAEDLPRRKHKGRAERGRGREEEEKNHVCGPKCTSLRGGGGPYMF